MKKILRIRTDGVNLPAQAEVDMGPRGQLVSGVCGLALGSGGGGRVVGQPKGQSQPTQGLKKNLNAMVCCLELSVSSKLLW